MSTITQGSQGIKIVGIDAPGAPTVTNVGSAGSTTYTYAIVAFTANGAYTEAGTSGSTATGNAALSTSNYNHLTWGSVDRAVRYDIYCSVGASPTGKVGSSSYPEFNDTTGVGDGSTAPTEGVTDALTAGKINFSGTATVSSDKKLLFRDSGLYIQSAADGKLTISADGSGTDDITLDGTVSISDDVLLATTKKVGFRDAGLFIQSAADGKLTISADGSGADDITLSGTVTLDDELTLASDKSVNFNNSKLLTKQVSIVAADIIATSAGKFSHASGYPLVADPGSGKAVELVGALLSFTYGVAAYTDGGNITINENGGAALTGLIAAANSVGAASDKLVQFVPLAAAAQNVTVNKGLNLVTSAAFTNGTATGTIKVFITYRVHTL